LVEDVDGEHRHAGCSRVRRDAQTEHRREGSRGRYRYHHDERDDRPVAVGLISLFLSGWSFIASIDEDSFERSVERRLACLELPGRTPAASTVVGCTTWARADCWWPCS
jgi:hypothetical protein